MTDKKTRRISAAAVLAALLTVLLLPIGDTGRIAGAIILIPAAIFIPIFIKKRSIHSINTKQVLLVMTVVALVLVMALYLSGLKFGFYKNPYGISVANFFRYLLPVAAIIVCSEIVRAVLMAQGDKLVTVLCYLSCVVADMLIVSNIPAVTSFNRFMDLVAGALFPALLSNLLYSYLSKRYGIYPNLAYRGITVLYAYIFRIVPGIGDSILNFFRLIVPIAIYLFIDALYEKKRRYALGNKSRLWVFTSRVLTVVVLVLMIGTVMLVSNQFRYGSLVIATESMTGELNKGDVVIFESYERQPVIEGQVIVFEKYDVMVVHRVVEIEIINGNTRYYTKGDANEDRDDGFITNADIVGLAQQKLPFLGYPTLWMRSLFKH
jgi:signal peptidase